MLVFNVEDKVINMSDACMCFTGMVIGGQVGGDGKKLTFHPLDRHLTAKNFKVFRVRKDVSFNLRGGSSKN